MAWFFQLSFDPSSQATLDRLATSIGLLVTAIGKGTSAMTALKDSADALVSVIGGAITEIGELAANIKNLTDKLAAAGNQAEIDAVTAELTEAAANLKTAVDGAASALPQPASAPPTA